LERKMRLLPFEFVGLCPNSLGRIECWLLHNELVVVGKLLNQIDSA